MRPKHYGCFRSRHETRHQLYRGFYTLLWSLLTVFLSGSCLEDQNINGRNHSPASFAAAAEALIHPCSFNGVPDYSITGHTLNTVSASDSGRSERPHVAPFSTLQAARAVPMPIKLHRSTTTVSKSEDRENHKGIKIESGADAAEGQQVSLSQNGYKYRVHYISDTARTAGDAYSSSAESHIGTALNITPVLPASRTKKALVEQSLSSSLARAQRITAPADDHNALQAVRETCDNCENTASALESNCISAGVDDGLQHDDDESFVLSRDRASFVATRGSDSHKTKEHKWTQHQVAQYASTRAPDPPEQGADNANVDGKTRLHEQGQENIQDDRAAAAASVRVKFSSASVLAGKKEVVNPAWIDIPSDTGEPSGAQGGDSGTTLVPERGASARRSRRGHRVLPRRPRAKQRGRAEPKLVGSDSSASGSPFDGTTTSTEASPTATGTAFAPPSTKHTHEQNSSVQPQEEGVTVPASDPTAVLGAEGEGLRANGSSSEKAEAGADHLSGNFGTGNASKLGSGAAPFSEDSLASGGSNSEGGTTTDAAVSAGALTGRLRNKSEESLTTREDTVESSTESDLSTLGSRFTDDSARGKEETPGNAAKPEDGGGKREQKRKENTGIDLVNIYKKATTTTPATNYLGAGYDPVKGNPAGDPVLMGDPGLRAPVIRLQYEQTAEGISNDLTTLQPLNGYVRPYIACRQSEAVTEIQSLRDYQKELAVDAALQGGDFLGANSFSASAGYKELAKEIASKSKKTYMLKRYCIRFEAGLAQSSNVEWTVTSAFAAAVKELPSEFDGKHPKCACTPDQWRQDHKVDICQSTNIPLWISFIEQFGTHYVVHLFAGGKMTYKVSMSAADAKKAKKKGINIEAQLKLQLGMTTAGGSTKNKVESESTSHKSELKIDTEVLVIGGRPPVDLSDPNALAAWVETVDSLPMPVKMEVQSLQHLLPAEKQDAFLESAAYYGKVVGMSLQDLNLLTGEVKTLTEMKEEMCFIGIDTRGEYVVCAAARVGANSMGRVSPGFAKCPPGKVVIYGFAMHLSFADNRLDGYHLSACAPGREKCDGVGVSNSDHDDARIYAVCGDDSINEVQQVVAESDPGANERGAILMAPCPDDTIVAAGFGFSYGARRGGLEAVDIEACKAGQTVCSKAPSPNSSKSFIWLVCVDKQLPGARHVKNVVGLGSVGKANKNAPDNDGEVEVKCPDGSKVVQGFVMEMHTSFQLVRDRFSHCKAGIEKCAMSGKGIDKGGLLRTDHHALIGWCVCDNGPELGSHLASDSQRKARIRMQKAMQKSKLSAADALVSDTDVNLHENSPKHRQETSDSSAKRGRRSKLPRRSTFATEAVPVQTTSRPVDRGAVGGNPPGDTERNRGGERFAVEIPQSEL